MPFGALSGPERVLAGALWSPLATARQAHRRARLGTRLSSREGRLSSPPPPGYGPARVALLDISKFFGKFRSYGSTGSNIFSDSFSLALRGLPMLANKPNLGCPIKLHLLGPNVLCWLGFELELSCTYSAPDEAVCSLRPSLRLGA